MLALLLGLLAAYVSIALSNAAGLERPSSGFVFYQELDGRLQASAITAPALDATEGLGRISLQAVNGHRIEPSRIGTAQLETLVSTRLGSSNRCELIERDHRFEKTDAGVFRSNRLFRLWRFDDGKLCEAIGYGTRDDALVHAHSDSEARMTLSRTAAAARRAPD